MNHSNSLNKNNNNPQFKKIINDTGCSEKQLTPSGFGMKNPNMRALKSPKEAKNPLYITDRQTKLLFNYRKFKKKFYLPCISVLKGVLFEEQAEPLGEVLGLFIKILWCGNSQVVVFYFA